MRLKGKDQKRKREFLQGNQSKSGKGTIDKCKRMMLNGKKKKLSPTNYEKNKL